MNIDNEYRMPPRWSIYEHLSAYDGNRLEVITAVGTIAGRYESKALAVTRAWAHFGVTRAEFEQMERCKQFVSGVGDVVISHGLDGVRIGEHEFLDSEGGQVWLYGPKETFQEIVDDWCDESCEENEL